MEEGNGNSNVRPDEVVDENAHNDGSNHNNDDFDQFEFEYDGNGNDDVLPRHDGQPEQANAPVEGEEENDDVGDDDDDDDDDDVDDENDNNDTSVEVICEAKLEHRRRHRFAVRDLLSVPVDMHIVHKALVIYLSRMAHNELDELGCTDFSNATFHVGRGMSQRGSSSPVVDPDSFGRVRRLRLGSYLPDGQAWRMPPEIAQFGRSLQRLRLWHCIDISPDIAKLERLRDLRLYQYGRHSNISFPSVELPSVTCFGVTGVDGEDEELRELLEVPQKDVTAMVSWMTVSLTRLKLFMFENAARPTARSVLGQMNSLKSGACIRTTLQSIIFENCGLVEDDFEVLFFDILPSFPFLDEIDVERNRIVSLRSIERRISSEMEASSSSPSMRLRLLKLGGNPVMEVVAKNKKEQGAFITLLQAVKSLEYIGHSCPVADDEDAVNMDVRWPPEIEYYFRINKCSGKFRTLAEGVGGRKTGNGSWPAGIPPSVWPIVLEMAYKKSNHGNNPTGRNGSFEQNATVLFYLLQHHAAGLAQFRHKTDYALKDSVVQLTGHETSCASLTVTTRKRRREASCTAM